VTLDNNAFSSLLVLPPKDNEDSENRLILIFGGLTFNKDSNRHDKMSNSFSKIIEGDDEGAESLS